MNKIRYEVDPHNRLVISSTGRDSGLPKFRKVLDGRFKTDGNNELSYHVKAPVAKDEEIPHQIRLKGKWSLTDNHELRLTLDKWGRPTFGDQITLQGEILDADKGSLSFAVTTTSKEKTQSTYVLTLDGSWKADEANRLSFHVRKERGASDILTFNGAWEIDKDHQIIYQYEKAVFAKKRRRTHALTFKGYWNIKDAFRVSYMLSADTDSVFDFKTGAGIFREDYIKYEVGIGLKGRVRPAARTVTLFGRWNFKKDEGLVFEIKYENKKTRAIRFGADVKLTDRDTLSVRLTSAAGGRDIGVNLELSRKIFKGDGEAILRLLKSKEESAVYAGSAWRW